jgi:hypothetical protein
MPSAGAQLPCSFPQARSPVCALFLDSREGVAGGWDAFYEDMVFQLCSRQMEDSSLGALVPASLHLSGCVSCTTITHTSIAPSCWLYQPTQTTVTCTLEPCHSHLNPPPCFHSSLPVISQSPFSNQSTFEPLEENPNIPLPYFGSLDRFPLHLKFNWNYMI